MRVRIHPFFNRRNDPAAGACLETHISGDVRSAQKKRPKNLTGPSYNVVPPPPHFDRDEINQLLWVGVRTGKDGTHCSFRVQRHSAMCASLAGKFCFSIFFDFFLPSIEIHHLM